jgi:hypothetical protein
MKCDKKMSFQECELAILRHAVDKAETKIGKKMLHSPEIIEIISIVEEFLRKTGRVCYGGTAINNILPEEDQFYNKDIELPDYDFFSPSPMEDAKNLADLYYKKGFDEVEAKAGSHSGTFKVFVNFIPVADISLQVPELYKKIKKQARNVRGIYYTPPNYLRMLMYLELSRPGGDVSRWEKVLKRLTLLNKHFPLKGKDCDFVEIQRMFDPDTKIPESQTSKLFTLTRECLINQSVVFFGAMANKLFIRNLKKFRNYNMQKIPDFDVLSKDPENTAGVLKEYLIDNGIKGVSINKKDGVGEVVAPHYDVSVKGETMAFIYEPLACHSYNVVRLFGRTIKIATIDTMLSFYLAFLYLNRKYYDTQRILCMSHYLFAVQAKNRLKQKGILKRFSIDCYGEEKHTKEKIRSKKSELFKKLKDKRGSNEWDFYFLKYVPADRKAKRKTNKRKTKKKKSKRKRKTKKRNFFF